MFFVPVLFGTVLALVILNSFIANTVFFILPVFFCIYLTFRFCDFCAKKNPKLYYTPVMLLLLTAVICLISLPPYDISFTIWFTIAVAETGHTAYYIAMFICSCFFIPSAVYYFTRVLYRPVFLLLLLIISFLFNDQRYINVPPIYMALAAGTFFLVLAFNGGYDFKNAVPRVNKRLMAGFSALAFLIALPISFVEYAQNRADISRWINMAGLSGILEYSNYSGIADARFQDERVVFLADAPEPLYFVRQTYNEFDGLRWYTGFTNDNYPILDWESEISARNLDALFGHMREAADAGYLTRYKDALATLENIEHINTAHVYLQSVFTSSILAPSRTFNVSGLPRNTRVVRNAESEILAANRSRSVSSYTLTYYSEAFRTNPVLQEFSGIFDAESYGNAAAFEAALDETIAYYQQTYGETPATLLAYKTYLEEAKMYGNPNTSEPVFGSERLKALTAAITDGLEGDYEKAWAIEQYFRETDYIYDLDYPREANRDIEYFIFVSKTGICGHYATAMAIMSQIAGLNVRYAEGFLSTEMNRDGMYVVRAKHAHAFVQVFIPPYGWVTFDPTVSSNSGGDGILGQFFGVLINYTQLIFGAFSILILAGGGVYFVYVYAIEELIFRTRVKRSGVRNSIILIYGRVLKIVRKRLKVLGNVPSDMARKLIYANYGADIGIITDCYDKAAFGGKAAILTRGEADLAFAAYKALYRKVNRLTFLSRRPLQT